MGPSNEVTVDGRVFRITLHALVRLGRGDVTLEQLVTVLREGEKFSYFHDGSWKDGHHHSASRIFASVANGTILTVIANVRAPYIEKLKAGTP